MSVFERLNGIDVSSHVEKKGNLTYLSWAWAWTEVKKAYPGANYKIYETADGRIYWTDGRTCWVKTGVIIEGLEHIEYLPIMDNQNRSIPLERVTSFDVNKAIQRSLTKAVARHGLGLSIYAGEDLPGVEEDKEYYKPYTPRPQATGKPLATQKQKDLIARLCTEKNSPLANYGYTSVEELTQEQASSVIDQLFKLPKPEPKQETNYDYPDPPLPF